MGRLLITLACMLLVGCALAGSPEPLEDPNAPPPPPRAAPPAQPPTPPSERARVAEKRIGGALAAPLHDVNLVRTKIPDTLLDAIDAPYASPHPDSCRQIAADIAPLDDALGPDLDRPPSDADPSAVQRGEQVAGDAAISAVKGAADSIIPMRSWVRTLTGAEQHDKLVRAAIEAGAIRRAYLKGLGLAEGCRTPAAPQPVSLTAVPGASRQRRDDSLKPKYPIQ
jgi:hypothetical protein